MSQASPARTSEAGQDVPVPPASPSEMEGETAIHGGDVFALRLFIACYLVMWALQIVQHFGIPWCRLFQWW